MGPPDTYLCPICKKYVAEEGKEFPFCSERCRLVDLGKWLSDGYRISRPLLPRDESGAAVRKEKPEED